MRENVQAPPVHLVLNSHPVAPARVSLVYLPLPGRLARMAASLAFFWGIAPGVLWVPPHYPWPLLSVSVGAYLAWLFSRPYRVRWFVGNCPRCGRALRVEPGTRIRLPVRITCFGCHFEPALEPFTEAGEEAIAAHGEFGIRHVLPDCAGTWAEVTLWDQPFLACSACGARHHATDHLRHAAAAENGHGDLLDQLASEGKYLA